MLWPLVLLLAATIEAGDVKTAKAAIGDVKPLRNAPGAHPARSVGDLKTLRSVRENGSSRNESDSFDKQVKPVPGAGDSKTVKEVNPVASSGGFKSPKIVEDKPVTSSLKVPSSKEVKPDVSDGNSKTHSPKEIKPVARAGLAKTAKSPSEVKSDGDAKGIKPIEANDLRKAENAILLQDEETIDFNLINGTAADIDEFPFYAMLSKRIHVDETIASGAPIKLLCGSSLVHPRFLISAWHCFKKDQDPKHLVAIFHITNRCNPDKNNLAWHELYKVYFYPGSITSRKAKRHDIVLIELLHEVTDVSPLLMPSQPPIVGTVGTIIGFGRTAWSRKKIDEQVPCTLRKTFETVESWGNCRHPGEKVIGAFCGVATTTTACRGDSGGPWLTWNNGAYELQGVVSFGSVQCDSQQANDHYTNVFAYKDWIFDTIRHSFTSNQARASSALLEPEELAFNVIDDGEPSPGQKYTSRAPVFPQILTPKKNSSEGTQSQPTAGSRKIRENTFRMADAQILQPQQQQPSTSPWTHPHLPPLQWQLNPPMWPVQQPVQYLQQWLTYPPAQQNQWFTSPPPWTSLLCTLMPNSPECYSQYYRQYRGNR